MQEFVYAGQGIRLSKFILSNLAELSYFSLQKLMRRGDIKVNGKKTTSDILLCNGDIIKVYYNVKPFNPQMVYEDANIVVYFKPIKIASQGENSFEYKIKQFINKDYILCHRLDTNTQGLLLFAKNNQVFEIIKSYFVTKKIERHYFAIVHGKIDKKHVFSDYLLKDSQQSSVKIFNKQVPYSQQITTIVTPISVVGELSHISVELITGKTHQIRAHLAYKNYPIIGDSKYAKQALNRQYKVKTQQLVAYKLIFKVDDNSLLQYLNNVEICIDYTKVLQI